MGGVALASAFGPVQQQYLSQARQMQALSFAVHIPLVCFGIAFPVMVLFMEWMYGRTVLGTQLQGLSLVLDTLPKVGFGPAVVWGDSFAPANAADASLAVPYDADRQPHLAEPMGGLVALFAGLCRPDVRGVHVHGGRRLGCPGRLVQQGADGAFIHGVHRQFSSAGTGSSARRSALRPLAVWLFTVPGVQPSSAAVSSTGRSQ